jgi:hypothetical protein
MTYSYHVILNSFVITMDGDSFLLTSRPILHMCAFAKPHHKCQDIFPFHDHALKAILRIIHI